MNLLWTNRSTGLLKNELQEGQKLGMPRFLHIGLKGTGPNNSWNVTFEFNYNSRELIYAKPLSDISVGSPTHEAISNLSVVHVPPFSGIGAEETRYDKAYQNFLIGQGKPGDILRNLLLDVYKNKENWDELCKEIEEIFGIELLPPMYEGQPFIVCEYRLKTANKRSLNR